MSRFAPGPDARRNTGRPHTAAGVAAKLIKLIGPEVSALCDQALLLARAGDPDAISACASLLATALQYEAAKKA